MRDSRRGILWCFGVGDKRYTWLAVVVDDHKGMDEEDMLTESLSARKAAVSTCIWDGTESSSAGCCSMDGAMGAAAAAAAAAISAFFTRPIARCVVVYEW